MVLRALRAFVFAASAFSVVAFLVVGVHLSSRHATTDPVEVAVVMTAERVAAGGPLYVEPAHADEPALLPAFPLAVSLLVRLFGPDLRESRFLALFLTLMVAGLSLWIVRLETRSWTLAVSSVGFVLMGCGLLAAPPGTARPEILMMVFVLLAFMALRLTNGIAGALISAALFALAFFTALEAAWFVAAALFALSIEERKRLVALALAAMVLMGGGYAALSQTLGPWFNFSAFDSPLRTMRIGVTAPLRYIGDHLLGRLAVPTLAAVLSFAMPTPPWRGKTGLWTCMGIGAVVVGLLATQSASPAPESRIPAVVALAILGPISMQRVTRHLSSWPGSSRLGGQGVVLAALTLQFIVFLSCLAALPWRSGNIAPLSDSAPASAPASSAPEAAVFPRG